MPNNCGNAVEELSTVVVQSGGLYADQLGYLAGPAHKHRTSTHRPIVVVRHITHRKFASLSAVNPIVLLIFHSTNNNDNKIYTYIKE
jgi:hypothetical protein